MQPHNQPQYQPNPTQPQQDTIFEENTYEMESNSEAINIEINIANLNRALRSTFGSSQSQLRLTKKDKMPLLALTVLSTDWTEGNMALATEEGTTDHHDDQPGEVTGDRRARERETRITQEIPIKILHESAVDGLHEPHCPDPDVHIILPGLSQLKSISDRFNKLASTDSKSRQQQTGLGLGAVDNSNSNANSNAQPGSGLSSSSGPKLELSANMHGKLKLAIATDELRIASVWSALVNPPLDPAHISEQQLSQLPSERMRGVGEDDESGWAKVRIDGKDWSRVLSVGRLSPKVVACEFISLSLLWAPIDECWLNFYRLDRFYQ
jgi:HUS1 checkpoint protein